VARQESEQALNAALTRRLSATNEDLRGLVVLLLDTSERNMNALKSSGKRCAGGGGGDGRGIGGFVWMVVGKQHLFLKLQWREHNGSHPSGREG
jgi:hypothetical protein